MVVASAMIFASSVPAVFAAGDNLALETGYEAESAELTIKGALPKAGRKFVNIIIAPYGHAVNSASAITDESVIVKSVQSDVLGNVEVVITMPDGELENRYSYYINTDEQFKNGVFATAVESELSSVLSAVNGASESNMLSVVKNSLTELSVPADNAEYVAKYLYAVKPDGGYDAKSLTDAYVAAAGLGAVVNDEISLYEYFTGYQQYLPEDYATMYESLNEDTQKELDALYKKYPVTESFDSTFETNLFVAKYKGIDSAADLEKLVLEYLNDTGYDLDDYNDIGNSVYQEKVFDKMYSSRKSVSYIDDITEAFDKAVQQCADDADDASSGSSGGGGGGGGRSGGTTGSIGNAAPAVTPVTGTFADMADHWAKADVETMYARGIVSGFPDGSFRPGQNVTRAEFAKMIAVVLGLDTNAKSDFADVASSEWYSGYVAATVNAGIVKGTSDTTFDPDRYITRQDAAVMLARVLDYKGKTYSVASKGFNDEASVADYAKDSVNGLANLGLINGYNGGFAPADNTTRAEAAALLLRVADYIK